MFIQRLQQIVLHHRVSPKHICILSQISPQQFFNKRRIELMARNGFKQ